MSEYPYSVMTRSTGLKSQSYLNTSYGSMYSTQYTARMKKIQELRQERTRVLEDDTCEARSANGFVFPSTQHMDITRGPRRGFEGFRAQDRSLPPNCMSCNSSRLSRQQSPSESRQSPSSNRLLSVQEIPPFPRHLDQYPPDTDFSRSYGSYTDDAATQDMKRVLYPPSPPLNREPVHPSTARTTTAQSVAQPYHLILSACVQEVTGNMDIVSERLCLLATTSHTNKIELSAATRTQLTLHGERFSIKILNPVSSGQKTIKFTAQFDSTDPQDFVELNSVLSEKTKIYIRIVVPNRCQKNSEDMSDPVPHKSGVGSMAAASTENHHPGPADTISDLGSESALG